MRRRLVPHGTSALVAAALIQIGGCSSVPDVRYEDVGAPPADGGSSGQAGREAGACPEVPGSVCCEAAGVACIGCDHPTGEDCTECAATCGPDQLCCKKGGPPVCKSVHARCN